MNLFSLKNKRALVTGSSRGLGLAIAAGLGRAGATVILNGRNETRLAKAVKSLRAKRIKTHGYPFDVTRPCQIEAAVKRIEKEVGAISILVNNAGINLRGPIAEMPAETPYSI